MSIRDKAPVVARVLLGLPFVVFGLNGFFHFLPMPPMEGNAATMMGGLAASGYLFPLLKGAEVVTGLLLLSGRFVPLALTILAPIVLNILGFHLFTTGDGAGMPLFLAALGGYLAWAYRDAFRGVLQATARPAEHSPQATAQAATAS